MSEDTIRKTLKGYERIIVGIDPGTNFMGYGIVGIVRKKPEVIALGVIYERVLGIVEQYLPDEMAIEAPFFGKNVQSMLKLGRAQGVAMAAALSRDIPVTEYEPRKIKMAITGNGASSKEQVREMLKRILSVTDKELPPELDATDALAAAMCHFYESSRPIPSSKSKSWKDFIAQNPDRVK